MDLSVAFLGTGGSVPSARRSTASVLVARGGERLLFDCGEGTQRQMQRSLGLVQVDEIYLTHFHADHILGLPGLLKTYDLTDREEPLTVYGPRGLRDLFKVLEPSDRAARLPPRAGRTRARRCGAARRLRGRSPSRSPTASAPAATRWSRTSARAASTPRQRKPLGVAEGPAFARAAAGGGGRGQRRHRRPRPGDGGEPRRAARSSITGDTAPSPATVDAAADAELLVHDASFAEEEVQRAAETGHSTVGQAAAVAARGPREAARPRPHLLPLPRRQGAGGGPGGLRAQSSPPATSTSSRSRSRSAASPSSSQTERSGERRLGR